jgi:DNA-binding NarL/FixJ family response regulator/signal transduction histidine kinase
VSRWARVRLYAAIAAGAIGLLVGVAYALYAQLDSVWAHLTWTGVVVVPFYVLAVWLVHHRPDHPQARRLLLVAAASAVGVAIESVVRGVYREIGPGDWLWAANLAHQYTSVIAGAAAGVLLASYPEVEPEPGWQRRVTRALWWSLALPPLMLLTHERLVVSPYLFESPAPEPPASPMAVEWLSFLGWAPIVLFASSVAGVVGGLLMLLRYVRGGRDQRLRMRPLAFTIVAGAPIFGGYALLLAAGVPEDSTAYALLGALTLPVLFMIPVSIAISVLRYRLFDIDVALRRSVVYGVLVTGIAVVYLAVAAAPGLALGHQLPVQLAVVMTVVAAVAFHPLRRRLEVLADRWVFGERASGYQLVTAFGATLEQAVDLTELLPRLARTVRQGLGAQWVRVALRGDAPGSWLAKPVGVAGDPTGNAVLVEELRHQDTTVGRIECGPSRLRDDDGYDQADRELLAVLAAQAAIAIANVRLTARLSEQVAELARSRARIVAAQDDERRRIERDIHDGVQQAAVALLTKLRLARNQLARGESPEALLVETQADASELLTDLRELAHGIHPPVLTDGGLVAAVEARAGRLPLGVTVRADETMRSRRFGPDIEAAAYFVACEALTNVVKHAGASQAVVSLTADAGRLDLEVVDDGVGVNGSGAKGTGSPTSATGSRHWEAGWSWRAAARAVRACLPPCRSGPSMPERLRVVLAEDNYLVREGTRRLLEDDGEVEVVAAVGNADELRDAVRRFRPDAVLTDIRMPPGHHMEGIEAAHDIRRTHPGVGVVVLSQHTDETYAFALLGEGTDGLAYLLKDRLGDLDELLGALRAVVAGGSVIDPAVVESLVARRSRIAESPLASLTPREIDVLREMAQGKTNAGIEEALHLSASTVEKHVSSIFAKLGLAEEPVHRRVAAVLAFLNHSS